MKIDLDALRQDAIYDIQNNIQLVNTRLDWNEFSSQVIRMCNQFLIAGSASLYVDLKPEVAGLNFCRAGENWRRLYELAKKHYNNHLSLNNNAFLFAAMLVNDTGLVNRLEKSLDKQYHENIEYEDNFHLSWLLLLMTQGNGEIDKVMRHLEGLERTSDDDLRVNLAKSLLKIDEFEEADFWAGFNELIARYELEVEKLAESLTTSITAFAGHRYIYFEALIWLKLAIKAGFSSPVDQYRFCPEELMTCNFEPYQNDWVILDGMSL